jgi:3-(3-hydroxy-phenyl)propionate hydroxylase
MSTAGELLNVDVAIVGFGPVGAVLAGLLGRRGLRVAVLEVERDVFPLPRAAHIDHQGLRVLQELGCLEKVLPGMRFNAGMDFVNASRQVLTRIVSQKTNRYGLPSSMYFHQPGFDRAIRDTVMALPNVHMFLPTQAVGIETHDTGATVRAAPVDGGGELQVGARYVVGCDGARSPTRTWLDIGLEDLGFQEQWLVVDLELKETVHGLPQHAVHVCDPARPHTVVPMPEPRYRFELMLLPGEDPEEMRKTDNVARLLEPWIPLGAARVERLAVYTFRGVVAQKWRKGPVLLAGDAAHLMPPFLGQGMCSGLRDASNLAWKLDWVLRGGAPESLLDTYERERQPHVRKVIQAAVDFGRIICTLDPQVAADRDADMLSNQKPTSGDSAFRLPLLQHGPLVLAGGGSIFVQPEISQDGRRLDDLVGPRFLVLGRTWEALDGSAAWWACDDRALVTTLTDVPDPGHWMRSWLDRSHSDVVVVRPDRYVLGAGKSLTPITEAVRGLLSPEPAPAQARTRARSTA